MYNIFMNYILLHVFCTKHFTYGSFDKTVTELTGQFISQYEPVFQSIQAVVFVASILKN